jgi:hypothetical protein
VPATSRSFDPDTDVLPLRGNYFQSAPDPRLTPREQAYFTDRAVRDLEPILSRRLQLRESALREDIARQGLEESKFNFGLQRKYAPAEAEAAASMIPLRRENLENTLASQKAQLKYSDEVARRATGDYITSRKAVESLKPRLNALLSSKADPLDQLDELSRVAYEHAEALTPGSVAGTMLDLASNTIRSRLTARDEAAKAESFNRKLDSEFLDKLAAQVDALELKEPEYPQTKTAKELAKMTPKEITAYRKSLLPSFSTEDKNKAQEYLRTVSPHLSEDEINDLDDATLHRFAISAINRNRTPAQTKRAVPK